MSKPDADKSDSATAGTEDTGPSNFIREIIERDVAEGKSGGKVVTRFPPEPNGYLHIGHAKSITLNFGMAAEFGGTCNLRFDDTNPEAEEDEYVRAIKQDVRWLGVDWADREFYASDYYERLYGWAVELVKLGKAYVCSMPPEQVRQYRGNFYAPGKNSPYRERSVEENLDLLDGMRRGEFAEGAHTLRAKIDMASPNLNLRDPPVYRIKHEHHHRTGDAWHIYPMYDFAHGLSDAIEGITHSLCTLEFEDHRPLYDWFIDALGDSVPCHPQQIEFAKLALSYTVLSKRRLRELVEGEYVSGWNDPRMPTISGMRRRGYTPQAIRDLCERVGVAKRDGVIDVTLFEWAVREDLNRTTPRVMAVLKPLKVVIENYPEGQVEHFDAPLHPEDDSHGRRQVPFSRVLYVEQDDFREEAPKKWFRLAPGKEVRLRYACLLKCEEAIKNDAGEVVELRCTWDPDSRGGTSPDGRKVRGTLHWVSAEHAVDAEVRLYDRMYSVPNPTEDKDVDYKTHLNPDSLEVLTGCKLEPHLATMAEPETRVQFERLGYFCVDNVDSRPGALVFNRTIGLRDSWAKQEQKSKKK